MDIELQLKSMETELKTAFSKWAEEQKTLGAVSEETKTLATSLQKRMDDLDARLAAQNTPKGNKSLDELLKQQDGVQRMLKGERGKHRISFGPEELKALQLERKATITGSTIGYSTAGVMPMERGGYVVEARASLRMRDVIPTRPTAVQHLYWPKANLTGTKASPVGEAALKPVNDWDPSPVECRVKTIATLMKASRQSMEDYSELRGILEDLLAYKVAAEEDRQILFGDNTGENLNGVTTQAQAWALTTYTTASDGYEYVDIVGGAAAQIAASNETDPTFVVLHPRDYWKIRLQKDGQGRYIFGDPASPFPPSLFGMTPVPTTQMTAGSFLVGSGAPAASQIRERMGVEVMISTEDDTNFQYNLVTIRAESRLAYCCYRPNAFVYGSLTQSPA